MDLSTHPHDCNNLRVAMAWAARGANVFPCHGKLPPRGVYWSNQSTRDPLKIWRFWERFPGAAPAMDLERCGEHGWICFDCDVAEDGLQGWDWLWKRCPDEFKAALEATPGSNTPSSGRHVIFQNDGGFGCGRGNLPPRHTAYLDVKGAGGYILCPGADTSAWGGGIYEPVGDLDNIPPLLACLIEELAPKPWMAAKRVVGSPVLPQEQPIDERHARYGDAAMREIEVELAAAPEGTRSDTAWKLSCKAGELVAGGCIALGEARERLAAATLPWGIPADDKVHGPAGTFERGLRQGMSNKARGPDTAPAEGGKILPLNRGRQAGAGDPAADPNLYLGYEIHWEGEPDRPPLDWLVDEIIPEKGVGILSGQWGKGKTLIAVDLAGAVATGGTFAGCEIRQPGGVLFVAAERPYEFPLKVKGLVENKLRENGHEPDKRLPFAWIEDSPNIQNKTAIGKLKATVQVVKQNMREQFDLPLSLIIIDSVTAVGSFDNANDASETKKVLDQVETLAKEIGAFVLLIDHFGKIEETGTRNSSAKEDIVGTVLSLIGHRKIDGKVADLSMAVRKGGPRQGRQLGYELRLVHVEGQPMTTRNVIWGEWEGDDRGGDPTASFVAKGKARYKPWPGVLRFLQKVMADLISGAGHPYRPWSDGPQVTAVTYEQVEAEFCKRWPNSAVEAKRKAWGRIASCTDFASYIVSRTDGGVTRWWLAAAGQPTEQPAKAADDKPTKARQDWRDDPKILSDD